MEQRPRKLGATEQLARRTVWHSDLGAAGGDQEPRTATWPLGQNPASTSWKLCDPEQGT